VYAEKLRSLDVKQRIYAEKVISEVIFEAQLGNLCRYTTPTALQDQMAQSQQFDLHFELSPGNKNVSDVELGGPSVTKFLNDFDPNDVNCE
jgi:hypothetical protein